MNVFGGYDIRLELVGASTIFQRYIDVRHLSAQFGTEMSEYGVRVVSFLKFGFVTRMLKPADNAMHDDVQQTLAQG